MPNLIDRDALLAQLTTFVSSLPPYIESPSAVKDMLLQDLVAKATEAATKAGTAKTPTGNFMLGYHNGLMWAWQRLSESTLGSSVGEPVLNKPDADLCSRKWAIDFFDHHRTAARQFVDEFGAQLPKAASEKRVEISVLNMVIEALERFPAAGSQEHVA